MYRRNYKHPDDEWCERCQTPKEYCVCEFVCAVCDEHPNECKCTVDNSDF